MDKISMILFVIIASIIFILKTCSVYTIIGLPMLLVILRTFLIGFSGKSLQNLLIVAPAIGLHLVSKLGSLVLYSLGGIYLLVMLVLLL